MDVSSTESRWASEIANRFSGDVVRAINPIVGKGSVNKVFVCETARSEKIIVRMTSAEDEERGIAFYEKERWCLEQAAQRGVPGPVVLAIGRWETRPYMLQTFVPGRNGEEASGDKRLLWHALGRHARTVHSVSLDGFGETLDRFHCGDAESRWHEFVDYNICSLTPDDELLRLGVYTIEQKDSIRRVFEQLRAAPLSFGLNHGDLSLRNILVEDDGTVNLLDWGSAEANVVPHYDFLPLIPWDDLQEENFQAFRQGYGMSEDAFAQLVPQLRSLLLLKSFDLTRWAVERRPERTAAIAGRAKEALRIAL